jgi:hypothetical protein
MTQDTEQTIDQLDAAARECGNRSVRSATPARVRLVSSAREIYFRCGVQWRNAAIAAIEDRANEKYANFHKRKDARLLEVFIDGETVRLIKLEEMRLSELTRRVAPGASGGFGRG